jgi:hypothetical protein
MKFVSIRIITGDVARLAGSCEKPPECTKEINKEGINELHGHYGRP